MYSKFGTSVNSYKYLNFEGDELTVVDYLEVLDVRCVDKSERNFIIMFVLTICKVDISYFNEDFDMF